MSLAQRVRDHRYDKGWGPDELAGRASISRTALYQIESGRTEQPRALTIRRIAEALGVSTEALIGPNLGVIGVSTWAAPDVAPLGPTLAPSPVANGARGDTDGLTPTVRVRFDPISTGHRERELERKFHALLASPLGEGLARILEESYRLLPRAYIDSSL